MQDTALRSEYSKTLKWLFATDDEREFKTLEDLSGSLGVTPPSVYRWRTRYNLDDHAIEVIRQRALECLPDVVQILSKKAVEGSPEHISLLLDFVGGLENKERGETEEGETS